MKIKYFIILLLFCYGVQAAPMENITLARQTLIIEHQLGTLEKKTQSLRADLDTLKDNSEQISEQRYASHLVNLQLAKNNLKHYSEELDESQQARMLTQQRIRQLQDRFQKLQVSARTRDQIAALSTPIQQQLTQQNQRLNLQNMYLQKLQAIYEQALQLVSLYEQEEQIFQKKLSEQLRTNKQAKNNALNDKVNQAQITWLSELDSANERLRSAESTVESLLAQIDVFYYDELVKLGNLQLQAYGLKDRTADVLISNWHQTDSRQLESRLPQLDNALSQAQLISQKLGQKQRLATENLDLVNVALQSKVINLEQAEQSRGQLNKLIHSIEQQNKAIDSLLSKIKDYHTQITSQLSSTKKARLRQSGYQFNTLQNLVKDTMQLPSASFKFIDALSVHIQQGLENLPLSMTAVVAFWSMLCLVFWGVGRHYLRVMINAVGQHRNRVTSNAIYITGHLFQRSLLGMTLIAGCWGLLNFLKIPFKFYAPLLYLSLVGFGFRFIIHFTRIILLEHMSDASGNDVHLYHRLKWTLVSGALITGLMVMAHQLYMPYDLVDFSDRLFMGFLLMVSIVLLKGRHVVPSLVGQYFGEAHVYFHRATRLLSLLIPLSILSNALVGLVGYIDLAWQMSYYQVGIVMISTAYVIIRGGFVDLNEWLASLSIRYLRNGWVLSEAFLKPLDKILRLSALAAAVVAGFQLFGLGWSSPTVVTIRQTSAYPIFTFSGGSISILSTVEFSILVAVVVWLGRWTREFSYRWIFRDMHDKALRKSLAAFCQYAVLTVGSIMTLRVWGIDFSGMAMILGGLAVGLGFGLRDVASNFVSGLMLMIERPLREGDLVSIGSFEGEVTHIGLRAICIRSWDYMEIMVPNAEIFNKSFVNWTLQDSIVRTTLDVRIHRDDDPKLVQQLISTVLSESDEILIEPAPQVLLKDIGEALIHFQVRYFINLQDTPRVTTRSKVLFRIYDYLKAHGIRPPYPQQELHLHSQEEQPKFIASQAITELVKD